MKKKIIIGIIILIGVISLCNLLFIKPNKSDSIENKQIGEEEHKTSEIKDNDINKEESDNSKDDTKNIQTENKSETNNSIKEDTKDHSNNSNSNNNNNSIDNATNNNSSNSSATESNDKSNNNSIPEVIETTPVNQYIGVPDPNSFNYSFHHGVIEYNSMDSCLAAVPNISFKDTTDILNCWCMDVVDGQGTVLGQYLYIKCSSGNCNKYK